MEDTVVEDDVVVGAIVDDTVVDLKITFELTCLFLLKAKYL